MSVLTISHVINFSMSYHIFDDIDCGDDICEITSQIIFRGVY